MRKAIFGITCWGCYKVEEHHFYDQKELNYKIELMKSNGWIRRQFVKSDWDKGPCFCCKDCAFNSFNAKNAELLNKK